MIFYNKKVYKPFVFVRKLGSIKTELVKTTHAEMVLFCAFMRISSVATSIYTYTFLNMEIANVTFSIADMVDKGIHLGHPRSQWNPKMAPYIYTNRNDVCIINLYRTIKQLRLLSEKLTLYSSQDKTFLFVGTKRQASEILETFVTGDVRETPSRSTNDLSPEKEIGLRQLQREGVQPSQLFYVNQRWLGGMLTNWQTIKKSLQTLEKLEIQESQDAFLKLPKKESTLLKKRRERLQKYLGGLKGMKNLPDVVIILGQKEEMNAVLECQKLGITTVSILDTDCDPTLTDLFVVANDDSKKSLDFLCRIFLQSISLGRKKQ